MFGCPFRSVFSKVAKFSSALEGDLPLLQSVFHCQRAQFGIVCGVANKSNGRTQSAFLKFYFW
jgi:hypothetical protein